MASIKKLTPSSGFIAPRKRVAAYARVSMETDQLMHSLSAQISHYNTLIQNNPEWEFAGVYVDEGVSAKSIKQREQFKRMIADCDKGKIDIILTKSVSRFARDTVDCLNTVRHLKDVGVEVRFEREGVSTFSADGEFLLTLLASIAQAERESIAENVRWTTRKRFEQGIPNGHKAPYGYKWDGEMFRIIPEQGKVVKYIFEQYLAGQSAHRIAKLLKEQGVLGQTGVPMDDSTVKDIVTSTSYMGTMILQKNYFTESHERRKNKGELPRYAVEEMFEPLVTPEEYQQAVAIRQKRAAELPLPVLTRFSGMVKCGICGRSISRRTARNQKKWCCNTRERKGISACDMRPILESELEASTEQLLGKMSNEAFRSLVTRITVFGDRLEVSLSTGQVKTIARDYSHFNMRNGYSGVLFCGYCGSRLGRDTVPMRNGDKVISWSCHRGSNCEFHRIKESDLRQFAAEVLATDEPEPAFVERVRKAMVFNDRIEFEFKDGTVRTWPRK